MLRHDGLLRRWLRLEARERPLALEAAAALACASLALRLAPRGAVMGLLRRRPAGRRAAGAPRADLVLQTVERVARAHPLRPRCLAQALAGRWMLARRGQASVLVLGARPPALDAHAWLEIDGCPMRDEARVRGYEPVWRSEP